MVYRYMCSATLNFGRRKSIVLTKNKNKYEPDVFMN